MHHIRLLLLLLPLLLSACLAGGAPEEGALARLPSVTPEQPTVTAATRIAVPTSTARAVLRPAPSPTSRVLVESDEGPLTSSMQQLGLGGERYATLGNPEAPVTMVEFADFGCPFCRIYAGETFPTLKTRYIDAGLVYYVYKDLPVVSERGDLAAQAAECAGELGAYWPMHQQLLADPPAWNGEYEAALEAFGSYADAVEVSGAALQTCVREGRYAAEVQGDFEEGQRLKLYGTPIFFIENQMLSGAQPITSFERVIDDLLAGR